MLIFISIYRGMFSDCPNLSISFEISQGMLLLALSLRSMSSDCF